MRCFAVSTLLVNLLLASADVFAEPIYGVVRSFPSDPSTADSIIITIPDRCGDTFAQQTEMSTDDIDDHRHELTIYFKTPDDPPICPGIWPPGGYHAFDIDQLTEGDHTVTIIERLDGELQSSYDVTFTVSDIAGKSVSGAWYNPEQSGRGIFILRMPVPTGQPPLFAVYWATHDADGNPSWALVTGAMNDNVVSGTAISTHGTPLAPGPAELPQQTWGAVSFEYQGCDKGLLSWDAADPTISDGSIELFKLANPDQQEPCSAPNASDVVWID